MTKNSPTSYTISIDIMVCGFETITSSKSHDIQETYDLYSRTKNLSISDILLDVKSNEIRCPIVGMDIIDLNGNAFKS